jgi:chorismate mutase
MPSSGDKKRYLVSADALPDIFLKVAAAKELLETGECRTASEAARISGISRSAFYKYKDAISPFHQLGGGIVTFHILLRDLAGVLSSILAIFAETGANILTMNQSIPINGTAQVTISAATIRLSVGIDELIARLSAVSGVIKIDPLAGQLYTL